MDRLLRILKIFSMCSSAGYAFADNVLWLAGIGYLGPTIGKYKWKDIKNSFSLYKTVLELIISIYNILLKC